MTKNKMLMDIDSLYKDEKYMPLLPLLEQSFHDINEIYPGITQKNHHELILYALDWQSEDHWQSKSMDWLENGLISSDLIIDKIRILSTDNRMSATLKKRMQSWLKNNSIASIA